MANIFIHITIIFTLLITGCASKLPPPTSTLLAVSPLEKIHKVENYLPVKGWFRWTEKTLVDRMENYKVPGVSIAVINNDEIEWAKGYGTLEVGSNKSVTPDTLFQSASIGKSLTGTGKFGTSVGRLLLGFCSEIKYGLGFILCGEGQDFIFWHVGHNLPGYRSLLVVMPEKGQGIAIMINGEKGAMLTAEIFYSFAQAYGWIPR